MRGPDLLVADFRKADDIISQYAYRSMASYSNQAKT